MIIAILSDTHDNMKNIRKALNIAEQFKPELIIHLGDFVAPFTAKPFVELGIKFIGVFGNNDGEKFGLKKAFSPVGEIFKPPYEVKIDDKSFLLLHEPFTLESYIKSQRYDYILYGHLHKRNKRIEGKTAVINPGEVCGWVENSASFVILNTATGDIEVIEL